MSVTKKRCIIKKLDFENCIVTNIKTKARGRKRLRARITREFEDFGNEEDEIGKPTQNSFVSSQRTSSPELSSPVAKKQDGSESPVFFSKRKIIFNNIQQFSDSAVEEINSPPRSPVFKIKTKFSSSKKQKKTENDRTNSSDLSTESSVSSDKPHCSYQIEELSQVSSQTIHISSFDSQNTAEKSSENCSAKIRESSPEVSRSFIECNPSQSVPEPPSAEETSDEILEFSKKRYKKNSLLGNLQKVLRKQASVKLLWQHQKRKNTTMNFMKLVVNNFWTVDCNYVLKCDVIAETQSIYVFVNSYWVPNIKKVKKGSILKLHPPWQQVVLKETNSIMLLNIVCLEVFDETIDFPAKETILPTLQSVPIEDFKTDETLFVRSLFSSQRTGFIC